MVTRVLDSAEFSFGGWAAFVFDHVEQARRYAGVMDGVVIDPRDMMDLHCQIVEIRPDLGGCRAVVLVLV